jgi:hypothetical protein
VHRKIVGTQSFFFHDELWMPQHVQGENQSVHGASSNVWSLEGKPMGFVRFWQSNLAGNSPCFEIVDFPITAIEIVDAQPSLPLIFGLL